MHRHEKKAFLKFFITYFLSVALLILIAGFFYYEQVYDQKIKMEEFSLIEYARHIKMGDTLDEFSSAYHHSFEEKNHKHIDIRNFTVTEDAFMKYIPMNRNKNYLKVFKSKEKFDQTLFEVRLKIVSLQMLLLLLFALLSYRLAKNALKPLQESIATLDRFAKDLIHDLNTPVTSIKLNMKILEKNPVLKENNALNRVRKSVQTISELHENLTILLQEETFQMHQTDLCSLVKEIIQIQKQLYPTLSFHVDCTVFVFKTNADAMRQILQNIISNACKYNIKNGHINVYAKESSLYVEDSGKGIKEPAKIFDRSYSGEQSSGIGLDIVKRLTEALDIEITVSSDEKGSLFILTMR